MKTTRNTIQRDLVLSWVKKLHHHPTADDVYLAVKEDCPSISKGTVYRNLNLLAEAKEIRRVSMPDGADRFDFYTEPHYHIKCHCCNRVFDMEMAYRKELCETAQAPEGFTVHGHDIVFQGICPDCNK